MRSTPSQLVNHPSQRRAGLYRTAIAGPGRSLAEAFAHLERSSSVDRLLRHADQDVLSGRVSLTPQEGEGYWELTRIRNDLYIILSNFKYHSARHETVPGDGLVQFNFKISGDLTYDVRLPGPLRFNRPGVHLWRQPHGIVMREWTAARAHERMITICIRPEFLIERFLAGNVQVSSQLQAFVSEPRGQIDFCELPMTSRMLDVIARLLANPYEGSLYLVYKEALVLELLCAVTAYCSLPEPTHQGCADKGLQAVQAARRLLEERLSSVPTVSGIARSVGLTDKTLTQAFKSLYGETVFDFGFRLRMERALALLRDQHRSVDEVSAAVGYAQPTSFATAFRRHFGLRPIDIKPRRSALRACRHRAVRKS